MKMQVTKLSLLLILLDAPEKVLQLLRSLLIKGWPSLWQWVGQQEVWEAQACVNTFYIVFVNQACVNTCTLMYLTCTSHI